MNSGIYKINNIITGKFYIGSSCNLDHRKKEHFRDLKYNKHHSVYLQRSFNKHGILNFNFEIILLCVKEQLQEKEQMYIDNLKPSYNMSDSAYRPPKRKFTKKDKLAVSLRFKGNKYNLGRVVSDETREKMSNSRKGKKMSAKNIIFLSDRMSKAVLQFSLKGEFIKEWKSAAEYSRINKVRSQNISRCCLGKQKSAYGFIFKFK